MTTNVTKHCMPLLRLGIPIIVGQLGTIVMGFADTLMIGRHSTQELAAAGFVNNIVALVLIAAMGFSYGLTPVVGALLGEGRTELIAQKLRNGLVANVLLALLLMLMMGVLHMEMHHLGLPSELLPVMRPYLMLLTLSIMPQMIFNAMKQFSDGIQDTRTPMWILLGSNAMNVAGNWLLIYGHCGLPEMGLTGAGMATLVSRLAMPVAFMMVFLCAKHFKSYRNDIQRACINGEDLILLCRMGIPVMLQLGMESASFALSAFYAGWLGASELAAHHIMNTVGQLCFMLYYGMAAAVAVRVSYFRGAGDIAETRRVALAGLWLTWGMGLVTALPVLVMRHQVGFFFTDASQVATLVAAMIPVFFIYQVGDALQSIYANALRGMADVKPMIWIAFVAYFVVSLPLGYLFGFICKWGIVGVWMAFPFGLTTAGLLYWRRFNTSTLPSSTRKCTSTPANGMA